MNHALKPRTFVRERTYTHDNISLALVVGIIIVIGAILAILFIDFSMLDSVILIASLFVFYSVLLLFLITPKVKQVRTVSIQRPVPVVQEVIREIEKPVVEIVEKPVVKVVEKPVVRIIEKTRAMPKAKKYKYVGSTEAKVYHQTSSRLARLIRPKNRIYSNSRAYFENLGFKSSETIKRKAKKTKKKSK